MKDSELLISKGVFVIVPVFNAMPYLESFLPALAAQGMDKKNVIFVDSSSSDGTGGAIRNAGYEVQTVQKNEFNHGATRQGALASESSAEIAVFLTQDAILKDSFAVARLVRAFEDPTVAMAYGRQLPRPHAGPIESFARLRNYPEISETRSFADRDRLGVKTVFCSNSFAAYRVRDLSEIGGFPKTSFAEDQLVAGRLLMAGKRIAYVSDAEVYHSHEYSIKQEFLRYREVGIFHKENRWLIEAFGAAEGEGLRFVVEEIKFLIQAQPFSIPNAFLRNVAKYLGYRSGKKFIE